jgi:hypothetical protein
MSFDSVVSSSARGVERNGSVSGLEQVPYTVLAVAGARVYHTKLNVKDSQWVYSHWKGTLTFGRDIDTPYSIAQGVSEAEKHWFRLADDETGRTVWMFKFPENFQYVEDRPFFHVFQGRVSSPIPSYLSQISIASCACLLDEKIWFPVQRRRGSYPIWTQGHDTTLWRS